MPEPIARHSHPPLRRPRLLLDAARAGQALYRRERDLGQIAGLVPLPAPGRALDGLRAQEAALDTLRRAAEAGYSPARHVAVMIALLAEMRLADDSPPAPTAEPAANTPRINALRPDLLLV